MNPGLPMVYRNRAGETLAADMFLTQTAETAPSLADLSAFAVMDPGTHGACSLSGFLSSASVDRPWHIN